MEDIIIIFCTLTHLKSRLELKRPTIIPSEKKAVTSPATKTDVCRFSWINVADQKEKAPSAPPIKKRAKPNIQKDEDLNIFIVALILNSVLLKGTYRDLGYVKKHIKAMNEMPRYIYLQLTPIKSK